MSMATRSPDMSDISEDATTVSSLHSASHTTSPISGGGPSALQHDSKSTPKGRNPRSRRNRSVSSVPEILQQTRMSPWPPNSMLAPYSMQYTYTTDTDLSMGSSGHSGPTKTCSDHFTLAPTILLHNGTHGGGMHYLTWEYAPHASAAQQMHPHHGHSGRFQAHNRGTHTHAYAHTHNNHTHNYQQQHYHQQYRNASTGNGGHIGGQNGRKPPRRNFQQPYYQPQYQNSAAGEHRQPQKRSHQNRQYNQYHAGRGRYYSEGTLRQSRSSSSLINHGGQESIMGQGDSSLTDIRAAVSAALAGLRDHQYSGNNSGDLHKGTGVRGHSLSSSSGGMEIPGEPLKIFPNNYSSLDSVSKSNPPINNSLQDLQDEGPDLERFLGAASPVVAHPGSPEGLAELSLSDLWRFYDHYSAFGLECSALGGPRGPSTCYFVPYLSAIHLFVPTSEDDVKDGLHYRHGLETWPSRLKKVYSWSAAEHVAQRMPLHDTLNRLTEGDAEHLLWSARFKDLHPYSWFAIAWYPLYRIPDAPLTARFLTFHSLAPLWEASVAAASTVIECLHEQSKGPSSNGIAQPPSVAATTGAVSYKMMLVKSGLKEACQRGEGKGSSIGTTGTVTPRAVASFNPGSPLASDFCEQRGRGLYSTNGSSTNGTSGGSAPGGASFPPSSRSHSLTSMDQQGPSLDTISGGSSRSSFPPSPAGSEAGDTAAGTGTTVLPSAATAVESSELSFSKSRSGELADRKVQMTADERIGSLLKQEVELRQPSVLPLPPLIVPVVGLSWHTAGSAAAENWTETLTLVSADQTILGSNNAVMSSCYTSYVVKKEYPLFKGGPLSWEIQLEELEEGAQRLALCRGLVRADQGHAEQETDEMDSCCPDYDFFTSRRR